MFVLFRVKGGRKDFKVLSRRFGRISSFDEDYVLAGEVEVVLWWELCVLLERERR